MMGSENSDILTTTGAVCFTFSSLIQLKEEESPHMVPDIHWVQLPLVHFCGALDVPIQRRPAEQCLLLPKIYEIKPPKARDLALGIFISLIL